MPLYLVNRTIQGLTGPRVKSFEGETVKVSEEQAAPLVASGSLTQVDTLPSAEDLDAVEYEKTVARMSEHGPYEPPKPRKRGKK